MIMWEGIKSTEGISTSGTAPSPLAVRYCFSNSNMLTNHPSGHWPNASSDSRRSSVDSEVCISNQLSENTNATDLHTRFWRPRF
jgi:hypothetical protein